MAAILWLGKTHGFLSIFWMHWLVSEDCLRWITLIFLLCVTLNYDFIKIWPRVLNIQQWQNHWGLCEKKINSWYNLFIHVNFISKIVLLFLSLVTIISYSKYENNLHIKGKREKCNSHFLKKIFLLMSSVFWQCHSWKKETWINPLHQLEHQLW